MHIGTLKFHDYFSPVKILLKQLESIHTKSSGVLAQKIFFVSSSNSTNLSEPITSFGFSAKNFKQYSSNTWNWKKKNPQYRRKTKKKADDANYLLIKFFRHIINRNYICHSNFLFYRSKDKFLELCLFEHVSQF